MSQIHESGRWSIPEAENAIKAAFFVKAVDTGRVRSMRYTDLRTSIAKGGRQISPRTLARALDSLEDNGEISRTRSGKEVRYTLSLDRPREEFVAIYANADTTAIQAASRLGAIGGADEGWAIYGFHPALPARLRRDLRREVFEFRDAVADVLEREALKFIRKTLRMVGRKLSREEARAGERALLHAFQEAWEAGVLSAASVWVSSYLERIAPGSVKAIEDAIFRRAPRDLVGFLRWVYALQDIVVDDQEIRRSVRREEAHQRAARRVFNALTPVQRERAAREFGALVSLTSLWCAVIR